MIIQAALVAGLFLVPVETAPLIGVIDPHDGKTISIIGTGTITIDGHGAKLGSCILGATDPHDGKLLCAVWAK